LFAESCEAIGAAGQVQLGAGIAIEQQWSLQRFK
jgi:hypothetical protein